MQVGTTTNHYYKKAVFNKKRYFKNCNRSNLYTYGLSKDDSSKDIFIKSPQEKPKAAAHHKKGQIFVDDSGELFVLHTTRLFREDLDWDDFGQYISQRFKDNDKVNVYDYACSDGSEAYSMVMTLKQADENPDKFFPIYAKDIVPEAITQKTKIDDEFFRLLDIAEENPEFFEFKNNDLYISPHITDNVEFSCANILEDIDFIDSSNPSIVMARNMWTYVDKKYYYEYANELYDKLAPNSVVVLGGADYLRNSLGEKEYNSFPNALIKAGFKPNPIATTDKECMFIFEKN